MLDRSRQAVLAGELDTVLHVPDDDEQAHRRPQLAVLVEAAALILHEVFGLVHLPDVVVEGADIEQEAVGADRIGCGLGIVAT